jgi:hypothetical protein
MAVAWASGAWASGAWAGTVWADAPAAGAAWSPSSWFATAWYEGAWSAGSTPPEPEPTPDQALVGGGYNPSQGNFGYPLDRRPYETHGPETTPKAGNSIGFTQRGSVEHGPKPTGSPPGLNALQSLSIDALLDGWEQQSHERRLAEIRAARLGITLPTGFSDNDALAILLLLSD